MNGARIRGSYVPAKTEGTVIVVDPHHFYGDPDSDILIDADLDPTFHTRIRILACK